MKNALLKSIVVSFLLLNTSLALAEDNEFRGLIWAQVVEPNGHVYKAVQGFENNGQFSQKQFLKFYQDRGQKVAIVNNRIVFDSSSLNKYHLTVDVQEKSEEDFQAHLKLFENAFKFDEKSQKKVVVSNLIKSAEIKGTLNSKNSFQFVDDNQVNFKVVINIDKVFSQEELQRRLKKYLPAAR